MPRLVLSAALIVALAGLFTVPARASSGDYYSEARPYYVKILSKLGRGVSNAMLCWTELYTQSYKEGLRASIHGETSVDTAVGTVTGLFVGVGHTALRFGVGVFDTVSFPIPTRPLIRPGTPAIFLEDLPASVSGGASLPATHR